MKPIIFCYLRTASRFLTKNFFAKTGVILDKTHDPMEDISGRISIGLIRNPQDSIASCLSMGDHFGLIDENLESEIAQQASVYVELYKKMAKEVDIIFPYDYLISNSDKVVEKISQISGIEINETNRETQLLEMDLGVTTYLLTSKTHTGYQKIYKRVMEADLEEAEKAYRLVLESPLIFNQGLKALQSQPTDHLGLIGLNKDC